jgi:hypothetical protein
MKNQQVADTTMANRFKLLLGCSAAAVAAPKSLQATIGPGWVFPSLTRQPLSVRQPTALPLARGALTDYPATIKQLELFMAVQHLLVLRTQPSCSCRGTGALPCTLPAASTPEPYFDRASRRLAP